MLYMHVTFHTYIRNQLGQLQLQNTLGGVPILTPVQTLGGVPICAAQFPSACAMLQMSAPEAAHTATTSVTTTAVPAINNSRHSSNNRL